jgi:hypothetical protein
MWRFGYIANTRGGHIAKKVVPCQQNPAVTQRGGKLTCIRHLFKI